MEAIQSYVRYNEMHKILICLQHKHAIVPGSGIKRHFQRQHPEMSAVTRQKIWNAVQDLDLADVDDVPIPEPEEYPIKGIEVKNGFSCNHPDCDGFCSGELSTIVQHCKTKHGRQENDPVGWREQTVQTIFQSNRHF
jgi:hypothetical protein